jgi:hypothetical protein
MNTILYAGSDEPVQLGDIVSTRVFFLRRKARVVYVPGISKRRSSLEHHGLSWVGLQELTGPHLAALVDPQTGRLDSKVKLVNRGEAMPLPEGSDPFLEPDEIVDDGG